MGIFGSSSAAATPPPPPPIPPAANPPTYANAGVQAVGANAKAKSAGAGGAFGGTDLTGGAPGVTPTANKTLLGQ